MSGPFSIPPGRVPPPSGVPRPTPEWRLRAGEGRVTPEELARLIDHTVLKAQATPADVERLCAEALKYRFGAVCINSVHVPLAAARLAGSDVAVCAVVGFPLGATAPEMTAAEAAWCVNHGAREIDMVISVGHLKAGEVRTVEDGIAAVVSAVRRAGAATPAGAAGTTSAAAPLVKVIIEACYLTEGEKVTACRLAAAAGAHYVKTSTGFGPSGATPEDVTLMRRTVGEELGVKAAGGIRDYQTALAMIAAGADRLGMSAGVAVIEEARQRAEQA